MTTNVYSVLWFFEVYEYNALIQEKRKATLQHRDMVGWHSLLRYDNLLHNTRIVITNLVSHNEFE